VNTKEKFYKAFFITSSENILRVLASFTIFLLFAVLAFFETCPNGLIMVHMDKEGFLGNFSKPNYRI